jgi:hypothetical protein
MVVRLVSRATVPKIVPNSCSLRPFEHLRDRKQYPVEQVSQQHLSPSQLTPSVALELCGLEVRFCRNNGV